MSVKSAQAVTVLFSTANASTGAAADADALPTGTLYVNGTSNAAVVTVTNITTGLYKAALTLPSLNAGDVVSLRIAATVATVAGEGVAWQDVADTVRLSDVPAVNVTTWKDATAPEMTGDAFARLGAPAGASVSADVAAVKAQTAAIETDTQDLQTQVGTDGAGLTALPWNAAWDAEVQSEATDALNAYAPPTKTELDSAVAALATAAALAVVDANVDAILEDTATTLPGLISLVGGAAGSGALAVTVTVNDESGNPLDGVETWITTDSAGANVVAGTLSTDALGVATYMLDAGTYYLWRQLGGYNFTNPTEMVVA